MLEPNGVFEEIKAFLEAVEKGVSDPYSAPSQALPDVAVIESSCSGGGKIQV